MKHSNLKQSLKKKLIAAFTLGFVAFSMMQPVTAKAETTAAHTDEKYVAKNPDNMLGMAADFGVFVKGKVTATGHSDTNVACGNLQLSEQNGITPVDENAVCYADQITSRALIDKGYIYIKSGNVTAHPNGHYWYVDNHEVGGNGIKQLYIAPNFINLEDEFAKLIKLSNDLSTLSSSNATYNTDSDQIICNGDFNVLNIKAEELSNKDRDLFINQIRGKKVLIVNVDMKDAGKDFKFNRKICFDNDASTPDYNYRPNGSNAKKFDQDATNIIWNFYNYSGNIETLKATSGIILAPQAFVYINSGVHLGSVIADSMKNNNEVHYVPSNHAPLPVEVHAQSVNGNCCPSKPLPGTVFQIYTKSGDIVPNTLKKAETVASGDSIATWILDQPGQYYIQETTTVDGYIKTPVKARFDVVSKDGKLEVVPKPGKEANGISTAWDEKTATVKIRHYSNEVVVAAFDRGNLAGLKDITFSIKNDITGEKISGTTDGEGLFIANIPESGYYTITQTSEDGDYTASEKEKQIVIYHTPIGHQMVVELDTAKGNEVYDILDDYYKGTTQIKKLTKAFNDALVACGYVNGKMTYEYESATDTCVVFLYDFNK